MTLRDQIVRQLPPEVFSALSTISEQDTHTLGLTASLLLNEQKGNAKFFRHLSKLLELEVSEMLQSAIEDDSFGRE